MQQKTKQQRLDELVASKEKHGIFVFKEGNRSRYIFPGEELPFWITKNAIPKYRALNRSEYRKLHDKKMPYSEKPLTRKQRMLQSAKKWFYNLRIRAGILQLMFYKLFKRNKND